MSKKNDLLVKWTLIKIVSTHNCKYCGEEYILTDLEKNILDKEEFKYPEHCSLCNLKFLSSFLNDENLYHRKDSKTLEDIISIYSDDYKGEVMNVDDYKKFILDDGGLKYSREITNDIFSDFITLFKNFPKASRLVYSELENGIYSSHVWWSKNIYLSYCVFLDCENVFYSFKIINGCTNIFSSHNIINSSNLYYWNYISNSHNIYFWEKINNCSDLLFCNDIHNSKECIFSCNQINSKYKIFNVQYSKEEYQEIKKDIFKRINNKQEFKFLKQKYKKFLQKNLVKQSTNKDKCEQVVWENIFNAKNCINTYLSSWIENCINSMSIWWKSNDHLYNIIASLEGWTNCENCVWICSFWLNLYNIFFSFWVVENCKNIYYSYDIELCEEIMFCVWLKNKKYCILNKQYEKNDYFKHKKSIIFKLKKENKWWDPIPLYFLNFPYNDTLAYEYFKVNKIIYNDLKEEIIDKNTKWIVKIFSSDFISDAQFDLWTWEKLNIKWRTSNKEVNIPKWTETIKASELPDIKNTNNTILNKAIICEKTLRPYRIIKQELDFLKKKNLPLPIVHNDYRITKLISRRPVWELYVWKCDKCSKEELISSINKNKYKIYCKECYKNFMYK